MATDQVSETGVDGSPSGPDNAAVAASLKTALRRRRWLGLAFLAAWGPGLVVMLADTDAGSLITAAQSGAQWNYKMILPQVILMPILYVVQEITVRLGIVTGRGHGALIRERFGRWWALLSAGTLFVSAIGALLTEFAGVAGVGEMFGISQWVTIPTATVFLLALALTGSYRRVERIGIAVGLAELVFFVAMFMAHPHLGAVAHGLGSMPLGNHSYLMLVAANVGAVIMPWMVFYQQGAVIDKKLSVASIRQARQDTAVGAVLTQAIMLAVVIAVGATIGLHNPGATLNTVGQIADALTPYLGHFGGTVLFGLGMLGAALVAAIVSSLAGAWGLAEVFGWKHTLNERPNRRTAKFYLTYSLTHIIGAILVLASVDLVSLSVDVEVMNALLLPIVLGFLLALEAKALPKEWQMRGVRKYVTWTLCLVVMGFGLYMVPSTLGWI
ncbi:NRAMP family divalent metal transporter [Kitasatospora kifunensis]|uniref:NRAMP (Natural resistance-associated macrophage protein)-like metal ion transporter n=1 Tax=Kitasatospora kifunensis TaxID=58351 RepID=A0A7W7R641_KITKI|nr:divalent metal cation transporter [Kitasatospora kifunensis]MBB4925954.1 NRAMP (natural resistance-associated macrophage protein)-like metal ion transporter [Kitasatospora kifunensis]